MEANRGRDGAVQLPALKRSAHGMCRPNGAKGLALHFWLPAWRKQHLKGERMSDGPKASLSGPRQARAAVKSYFQARLSRISRRRPVPRCRGFGPRVRAQGLTEELIRRPTFHGLGMRRRSRGKGRPYVCPLCEIEGPLLIARGRRSVFGCHSWLISESFTTGRLSLRFCEIPGHPPGDSPADRSQLSCSAALGKAKCGAARGLPSNVGPVRPHRSSCSWGR